MAAHRTKVLATTALFVVSDRLRQSPTPTHAETAMLRLKQLFDRNGYVRRQDKARLKAEGHMAYKKGDEVRLVAQSIEELKEIRRLLRIAEFKPGRPFRHARHFRQPLYGRAQVARFLEFTSRANQGIGHSASSRTTR